jgi:hypothetical protein
MYEFPLSDSFILTGYFIYCDFYAGEFCHHSLVRVQVQVLMVVRVVVRVAKVQTI